MTSLADRWNNEFWADGVYGHPFSVAFLREYPAVPWGARIRQLIRSILYYMNPRCAMWARNWPSYFHRIRNDWRDAMDEAARDAQREWDGYGGGYWD